MIDIYDSAIGPAGRYGAAFEADDETAWFYLLDLQAPEGQQVISAFNALAVGELPPGARVSIRWNSSEAAVGLYLGARLSALFDLEADEVSGRWATEADQDFFQTD